MPSHDGPLCASAPHDPVEGAKSAPAGWTRSIPTETAPLALSTIAALGLWRAHTLDYFSDDAFITLR